METAQFVDPDVSRAKFDREIEEFRALEGTYLRRGWLLVRAAFPCAVVVLAAPQLHPPAIVTGVAFDYTNYDAQPPSVQLVHPFTLQPYRAKELPTNLRQRSPSPQAANFPFPGIPEGASIQFLAEQPLMQSHSPEEVPFLCLAGVREYHEHPAHTGDAWELHRAIGAGRMVRLLEIIYKYGVQPITTYGVQLIPQINFQQGQAPE